jgi:hypothetical protein
LSFRGGYSQPLFFQKIFSHKTNSNHTLKKKHSFFLKKNEISFLKSIYAIPISVLSALKGQVDKTAAAKSGHLNFKHIA